MCECACVFMLTSNNYCTVNVLAVFLSHLAGPPYAPS